MSSRLTPRQSARPTRFAVLPLSRTSERSVARGLTRIAADGSDPSIRFGVNVMRPVVALCAIGVVGCAACSRPQAQSRSSAVPTVAVAKVARGDVSRVLTVAAEFRPYQEIDVHAKVA